MRRSAKVSEETEQHGQTVRAMLSALLEGWDRLAVRVRQDGKMRFLPLAEVKDQRLVYRIVMDLLRQAAQENGIGRK